MTRFNVELFAPDGSRLGWANDYDWLNVTPRFNRRANATVAVPLEHTRIAELTTPGTRVHLTYQPPELVAPVLFTGRVNGFRKPEDQRRVEAYVTGDWSILDVLCWPVPGAAIGSQTSAYYEDEGPAESVIKALVQANLVDRLGVPVTIGTDLGRGSTVATKVRFALLSEEVERLADLGGIGVTLYRDGAGYVLDCYTPTDRTARVLSEANGALTEWSWEVSAPTATRVVAGGPGDGTSRALATRVDTAAETAWGVVLEAFADASDAADPAELDAKGDEALAEAAATSGFSLSIAETAALTYGKNLIVGDLVRVETLPGVQVDDVLREVHLSQSADEGPKVTPMVGWSGQSPQLVMATALRRMARALRRMRTT